MQTKHNALLFWYNLKGNYDLVIFDNGHTKNKFKKEYTTLYEQFINEEISFDEFTHIVDMSIMPFYEDKIKAVINDLYWRDIRECYYIYNNTRIILDDTDKLDYGF